MENLDTLYNKALDELNNGYAAFHKVGVKAYDPGLGTTLALAERLGNPHKRLQCIHVGGTNGKGSTTHTLASVLQEAGYRVGLYTSPHLLDFRERIRVDGKMISKEAVVEFVDLLGRIRGEIQPSFFEVATLMAFWYFERQKVDVAVIEVGLGGRLDSTNIITPILSTITNISLDHTAILGDSEEAIAREKAGIIKPGVPVVIGESSGAVREVFRQKALECGSKIVFADDHGLASENCGDYIKYTNTPWGELHGELTGDCQSKNAATVVEALKILSEQLYIPSEAVQRGFAKVEENTGLMGRWMTVATEPVRVICDTGHNIGGWQYLGPRLCRLANEGGLHVVLGFVSDKDVEAIMSLLPENATYYFTEPNVDRRREAASTAAEGARHGLHGQCYANVAQAYAAAKAEAKRGETVFVGGSTFIVAELLEIVSD